jgi:hypothetical protein
MKALVLFYLHKVIAIVMFAFFMYAFIDSALPTILKSLFIN